MKFNKVIVIILWLLTPITAIQNYRYCMRELKHDDGSEDYYAE